MIEYIDNIVDKIDNFRGEIIFCGNSFRTREIISTYNLESKISYIFDNIINESYLNIKIINEKKIKELRNPLFIICGNHSLSFYSQLKKYKSSILIEYDAKLSSLFDDNFNFEVDVPDYQSNHGTDISHKFIPLLISELLKFNKKIVTTPTKHCNDNYFKERVVTGDSLHFSYHSFGEMNDRIIYFKEGYFFDLINCDDMGYSGWSSLCSDKKEVEKIYNISISKANEDFRKYKEKYILNNLSKYKQPEKSDIKLPSSYIFLPLQVFNDSVMKKSYNDPFIWLNIIVKKLTLNNINIVIKRHPRCNIKEISELINKIKNNNNITIYDGSIHEAIKNSQAVYVINSGVGFESLFHLKPVITFGRSDYESATYNIKDINELDNNFIPKLSKEKIDYIKKFISYYMENKNILIEDKNSIKKFVDSFVLKHMKKRLKEKYE